MTSRNSLYNAESISIRFYAKMHITNQPQEPQEPLSILLSIARLENLCLYYRELVVIATDYFLLLSLCLLLWLVAMCDNLFNHESIDRKIEELCLLAADWRLAWLVTWRNSFVCCCAFLIWRYFSPSSYFSRATRMFVALSFQFKFHRKAFCD